LFLFDTLPETPWQALEGALSAESRYTCITLGAENKQGNKELMAHWRIDGTPRPILIRVPSAIYRPTPPAWMQQVRAKIQAPSVQPFEYLFERESVAWDPEFAPDGEMDLPSGRLEKAALDEAGGGYRTVRSWKLVRGLTRRLGSALEKDDAALKLAAPESGSFILVSLRR